MAGVRKRYEASFKARVALESLKGERTISELSSEYVVHGNLITQWRKRVLEELPGLFSGRHEKEAKKDEELVARLYQQIGQLKVELDWLKKKLSGCIEDKRRLIDPEHPQIPIERQCELLGLPRSSFYYRPAGVDRYNEELMKLIDEQYTRTPFYGRRRMTAWLRSQGHGLNIKRVSRLMSLMGLEAIYPKPRLSLANSEHRIYPYLLKGLPIIKPDQVWCADITYIRLRQGFIYLMAVMDWFSRYVLSWAVSITLEVHFCLEALEGALGRGCPEIFNTDQGSQFTSHDFTRRLKGANIRISMDGRGRVFDNIFVERLWRSVKYEEVYLKDYQSVKEAISGISSYFRFYNDQRPHQALGYETPGALWRGNGQWN